MRRQKDCRQLRPWRSLELLKKTLSVSARKLKRQSDKRLRLKLRLIESVWKLRLPSTP